MKDKIIHLCDYGCGREAIHKFKNGKWCCSKNTQSCPAKILNNKPNLGRKFPIEVRLKLGKKGNDNVSKRPEVQEKQRQYMLNGGAIKAANAPRDKEKMKNFSESQRIRMLNGGAIIALNGVISPSKPQIKLFKLVSEIYPLAELEFWEKRANKRIDIVIKEYMIAIEYDGSYWHQDKERDIKRQKSLEDFGWKFIRYKDKIPSKKELLKDINSIRSK